eukprot:5109503-Prymnesium_polylepis.2
MTELTTRCAFHIAASSASAGSAPRSLKSASSFCAAVTSSSVVSSVRMSISSCSDGRRTHAGGPTHGIRLLLRRWWLDAIATRVSSSRNRAPGCGRVCR